VVLFGDNLINSHPAQKFQLDDGHTPNLFRNGKWLETTEHPSIHPSIHETNLLGFEVPGM